MKINKFKTNSNSYEIDFSIELPNNINCWGKIRRYNDREIKTYAFDVKFKSFYHKDIVIINSEYYLYESCSFGMSVPFESNDIYFYGHGLLVELVLKFDSFKESKKFILDLMAIEIKKVNEVFDIKKKCLDNAYYLRKENGEK